MGADGALAGQLADIFGSRLKMVAGFGAVSDSVAIVESLTQNDLDRCASLSAGWKRLKLHPPLLLLTEEIARGLDAFPLEFNEIIATRRLIAGTDLFALLSVPLEDLRRACEVQARGHLVHLREAYIEAAGDRKAIAALISASVLPFRSLLANIARLDDTSVDDLVTRLALGDFSAAFPDALHAAERLVEYVDRWRRV